MAKWLKLNVEMESRADLRRNSEMGIDAEVEKTYNMVMVDAEKISTYSPLYNDDNEASATKSELTLDEGGYMIVDLPFEELDKLIRKPVSIGPSIPR